jgi:hypothetical protein
MSQAIGLAMIIVVIAIFLPSVLHALENFLLLLLVRATSFVQAIPIPAPGTANLSQTLVR